MKIAKQSARHPIRADPEHTAIVWIEEDVPVLARTDLHERPRAPPVFFGRVQDAWDRRWQHVSRALFQTRPRHVELTASRGRAARAGIEQRVELRPEDRERAREEHDDDRYRERHTDSPVEREGLLDRKA